MKGLRVFIGCITGNSSSQELVALLSNFAKVQGVMLASERNPQGNEYCLGYGFAVCNSREDVDALLAQSNKLSYRGRFITLREYKVGSKLKEDKKKFNLRRLFIGNVPQTTSSAEIAEIFSKYGKIENVYFVNKDKDQSYKYGYIVFLDQKAAESAISDPAGFQIGTFKLRVEFFGGKRANNGHYGTTSNRSLNSKITSFPEQEIALIGSNHNNDFSNIKYQRPPSDLKLNPLQNTNTMLVSPSEASNYQNQESSGIPEGSPDWRKALFHRHKTCSLEYYLPLPEKVVNLGGQGLSTLEPNNPSNNLPTMASGQAYQNWLKLNSSRKEDFIHDLNTGETYTGVSFLSSLQLKLVDENHGISNVRLNQPSLLSLRRHRR